MAANSEIIAGLKLSVGRGGEGLLGKGDDDGGWFEGGWFQESGVQVLFDEVRRDTSSPLGSPYLYGVHSSACSVISHMITRL